MTQLEALKQHFNSGQSLTVLEALQRFGCYALSQRVGELRREGYPIMSSWVQLGNGKKIKRYAKTSGVRWMDNEMVDNVLFSSRKMP